MRRKTLIKLSELSDYARKQIQRKKKFALVNNGKSPSKKKPIRESEDVIVDLDAKQVKELDRVFSRFDSDLNLVLQSDLSEKKTPEYTKMSSKELEETGVVLKVDASIMDGIDELLELGGDAKNWYSEMNKTILEAFGDSDGTLFLVLLAIFSPRNPLSQNFKLAAQTYRGLKKDLSNEESKKRLEEMIELEATPLYNMMKSEDAYKDLATVRGMLKGNMGVRTYLPNIIRFLRLYKSMGYSITREVAVKEIAKHIKPSGGLKDTAVISAEKVFSFTLNLLDPNYKFEELGWVPVTMDTWMGSFFYPMLNKKQKSKLLAKEANYVYMAKLTQELAGKYGMTPPEFQAAIWVGLIKKERGENYDNTFLTAIDKNLKKLNIKIEEIKNADNFFKRAIAIVGDRGFR